MFKFLKSKKKVIGKVVIENFIILPEWPHFYWYQRLLFGDTDFQIILNTDINKKTFTLLDPEHRILGQSDDLDYLKLLAQKIYLSRKEFEPKD